MPWIIEVEGAQYCVHRVGDDEPVPGGCHPTYAEAEAHRRALYASENKIGGDRMSGVMRRFVPITKVDAEKREVWGVAAEESPDKSGEIMDYASSKPEFEAWSKMISEASGGKSLGNVRAMHANVAAGKLIHFEPRDEERVFYVGAKIVDDSEWRKVLEGVYTGFSVGGDYIAQWLDAESGLMRYTAKPAEISLADNPCMYGATFDLVRAGGVQKAVFRGGMLRKFDLEERAHRVRRAFYEAYPDYEDDEGWHEYWCYTVLDDRVIYEFEGELYALDYTVGEMDGKIAFGDTPVRITVQYVPVSPEDGEGEEEPQGEGAEMVGQDAPAMEEMSVEMERIIAGALSKVSRSVDGVGALADKLDALEKRLAQIEAQPASSVPVLRQVHPGGVAKTAADAYDVVELRRLAATEPNPVMRAEYQRQLLLAEQASAKR